MTVLNWRSDRRRGPWTCALLRSAQARDEIFSTPSPGSIDRRPPVDSRARPCKLRPWHGLSCDLGRVEPKMKVGRLSWHYPLPVLASLVGGCIISNTPGDLTFASAELADRRDRMEMPGPGALLKIEFTSRMDLSKFAMEHSYNLGAIAFFCGRPNDFVVLSFPDVYWRRVRLGQGEADPIERGQDDKIELLTYYLFINVAREAIVPSKPREKSFDLRREPEDVCFHLRGGNESGRGYKSNTVVIPKDAIESALAEAPMRSQ
jgi:hypothetical protein